ncbi:corrinoid adenosyltransferase domain protein [Leptospira interrogans serovar Pyrogenes str. 200701872]|nr:corrinoid adenosyltransferase domain protein [Leptospira interrogans serovar Pyrogenes str. 200701872]KPA33616.1 Cob(I)yrinic acid a,c-diamide adenosyltransferase [Leptospira interrogans]
MGLGFTWNSENLDKDKTAARMAWTFSSKMILEENYNIIILDEITYTFHYGWLNVEEVINILKKDVKIFT